MTENNSGDRPELTNPDVRYERQDINLDRMVIVGIGIFVVMMIVMVVIFWILNNVEDRRHANLPTPLPLIELRPTPPPPRLQPNPIDRTTALEDMAALRAAEDQVLNNYSWVDEENGVARIPIERAMEIFVSEK